MITKPQLVLILGAVSAEKWHSHLVSAFEKFGITSPESQAMFLAQTGHESGDFTRLSENMNYSVQALINTYPRKRISIEQANALGRKPGEKSLPLNRQEAIANLVYANRYGNGSQDGWKYRGRGPIQITFKDNYAKCGKALGVDLIAHPELLEQEKYAVESAAWFFTANGCNNSGDVLKVTKIINGGTNGLEDRKARFEKARKILLG